MKWIVILAAALHVGCAAVDQKETLSESSVMPVDTSHVLAQAELAAALEGQQANSDNLMEIDAELRQFIDSVDPDMAPARRFRKLIGMLKSQGFELEFDLNTTTNASLAFSERRGNCISFSALIVAIARDVGLEANFNLVETPTNRSATRNSAGQKVIQNVLHVNAEVSFGWTRRIIEFNFGRPTRYAHTALSDDAINALYLNNLALESSYQGNHAHGISLVREAIELQPEASHLWTTLGYLYRKSDDIELSRMSYEQALNLDQFNTSAIRNLRNIKKLEDAIARQDQEEKSGV